MSQKVKQLQFSGTSASNVAFPFLSTQGWNSLSFFIFSNAAITMNVLWSPDGVNTDLIEATVVGAGTTEVIITDVKASFVSVSLVVTGASTMRLNSLFFLNKIGSGVQQSSGFMMSGFGFANLQAISTNLNQVYRISDLTTGFVSVISDSNLFETSGSGFEISSKATQTILLSVTANIVVLNEGFEVWVGIASSTVYRGMYQKIHNLSATSNQHSLSFTGVVDLTSGDSIRLYWKRVTGPATFSYTMNSLMYTGVVIR